MSVRAARAGQVVQGLLLRRRLVAEIGRGRARIAGLLALGVGLGLLLFGVGFGIAWYLVHHDAAAVLRSGASYVLWFLPGALLFTSLGHAAQFFFQAKDLWMWDSAPTGAGARFADRFNQTAAAALPPMVAMGSLFLMGWSLGGGLGVLGALRALVAVVVVVPLPLCAGIVLAHVGGAVLPAGELRRWSLLLLGVALTAGLVVFRQARVERLLTEEGANQLLASAKTTSELGPALSPPRQLASFVVDGDAFAFFFAFAIMVAAILLAFATHALLYDRARKLAVDESPTGVLQGSLAERVLTALAALVPGDVRPLFRKDLLAFVRDPGQWGQVVLLVGVGVLYVVNVSFLRDGFAVLGAFGDAILVGAHTGIVSFIAGGLAARFAFPQLGLEGPAIWILDGAPLRPQRLLLGKWLSSLPVVVVYPALLAVIGGVVLGFSPLRALWTSALIITVSLGIAATAVFRGAHKPVFDAASLSELAMGPGAISTMILATTLAFFASCCALTVAGVHNAVEGAVFFCCWLVGVGLPVLAVFLAARSAFKKSVVALLARRADEAVPQFATPGTSVDALE